MHKPSEMPALQVKDYWQLSADDRLALLRALVHTTADTEAVRQHLQDAGTELMNEQLCRGLPIGVDDTGSSYYQLASDAGSYSPLPHRSVHTFLRMEDWHMLCLQPLPEQIRCCGYGLYGLMERTLILFAGVGKALLLKSDRIIYCQHLHAFKGLEEIEGKLRM